MIASLAFAYKQGGVQASADRKHISCPTEQHTDYRSNLSAWFAKKSVRAGGNQEEEKKKWFSVTLFAKTSCLLSLHHQLPPVRLPVFDHVHVVESGRNARKVELVFRLVCLYGFYQAEG